MDLAAPNIHLSPLQLGTLVTILRTSILGNMILIISKCRCPQWPHFCLISSFHKAYISLPWLRFPKCFMIGHGTALSSTLRNNSSRARGRHWSGGCRDGDTWNCKIAQSNNKVLWNVSTALGSFTHVIYVHIMYMNAGAGSDSYVGSSPSALKRYSCSVVHVEKFHAASPQNLN